MGNLHDVSPRFEARITGVLYLLNILLGILALTLNSHQMQTRGDQINFIAGVIYTAVTVLLWHLFRPVSKWLSAVAAFFSLLGCWIPQSVYSAAHVSNLAAFGIYCILIAYLTRRSHFFPRALAVSMACSGICWLTTIWPSLSRALSPYAMIVGVLGEATFMGYLVIKGLDEVRWRKRANIT